MTTMTEQEQIRVLREALTDLLNAQVSYQIAHTTQFDQKQRAAAELVAAMDKAGQVLDDTDPASIQLVAAPEPEAYTNPMMKGVDAKGVMMSAHALTPHGLSHPDKMRWMSDYFLKNYTAASEPVAEWVNEEQGFQYLVRGRLPDGTKLYTAAPLLRQEEQPAQAAPDWISVDERLPADETPVIILLNGTPTIGELRWEDPNHEETYQPFRYWDNPSDDGQCWGWSDITHWMSLPEVSSATAAQAATPADSQKGKGE